MILNPRQGNALAHLASALRPEWTPEGCGTLFARANTADGYPAADFPHAVRALMHYAAETSGGTPAKKTPAWYPKPGPHWDTTAPKTDTAEWKQPRCEDHPEFPAANCRCCIADVKTGHRPQHLIGKHHDPDTVEGDQNPDPATARTEPCVERTQDANMGTDEEDPF